MERGSPAATTSGLCLALATLIRNPSLSVAGGFLPV